MTMDHQILEQNYTFLTMPMVAASNTLLGNPISADYDADSDTVFIAERANGGGRVLAFEDTSAGGNLFPRVSIELSGASSVYFNSQD